MAGVMFHSNMPSREKIMSDLEKRFKTSSMKSQYLPYQLEGKGFESLPVFNFKAMVITICSKRCLYTFGAFFLLVFGTPSKTLFNTCASGV